MSVGATNAQQIEALAPSTFIPNKQFPVVLEARVNGQLDRLHSEELTSATQGTAAGSALFKIKKGRAMATLQAASNPNLSVSNSAFAISVEENENAHQVHSGSLSGLTIWASGTVHHITSEIQFGANDSLIIESGCWVLLDSAVNMVVSGFLKVEGNSQSPVVFCSNSADYSWGGISINQGKGEFSYCLFTAGGGDESLAFGHSGSQAVLKTVDGIIEADHCFVFDCAGKGIGGQGGSLSFSRGGISRCDMGGEFSGGKLTITDSHIIDIPNDDGIFVDDDNDGLYLSGSNPAGPSVIDSCIFMFGKDDAIDHNGAVVQVRNSWVENFEHEGIAASNQNSITVFNSVFKNCEQGIEAGYGSPTVTVDHCVIVDCDNGLRFGDWYNWGCTGQLTCTNSITWNNTDNVHNFDVLTNGPVSGALDVTYSLTNDAEYDSNLGCLAGQPVFTDSYQLTTGSAGIGLASDGLNMGLVSSLSTGIPTNAYHQQGTLLEIRVYDLNGRLIDSGYNTDFQLLKTGIYIVEERYQNSLIRFKKTVIQ